MDTTLAPSRLRYVLVTPARNEENFIENTIRAVVAQKASTLRWVIVSDGSTDRTDEIVKRFVSKIDGSNCLRMPEHRDRNFAAKADCFNAGYDRLKVEDFDLIGNLDADITFDPDYYAVSGGQVCGDATLGVAGTPFVEDAEPATTTPMPTVRGSQARLGRVPDVPAQVLRGGGRLHSDQRRRHRLGRGHYGADERLADADVS